ncbi:DUF3253 domain-containing protein [Asticcacaulis endophyticus]|uniref:DUF3253 domain-containing protein n=1 Tax=Asticcacaulis endophyticus TaxID=1395890 RepID=A0A918UUC7_9CAUL|nr:DUF3253 domain-containing protein [Asticcacaulis endophyticus]GGZ36118.1 hypothetical protein GCM10011273_23000 [Asticcacaulis endophyticus]
MSLSIEDAIFDLLSKAPPGESINPNQVAQAVDPEMWRRQLPKVRTTVVGLARQGKIEVLRKGKPADPNTFKGIYRLRLPIEGE